MKNKFFILILSLGLLATFSFDEPESIKDLWQKVEYNIQNGKPVEASKILDKIIVKSKAEHLTVDLIKAYGYKRKVSHQFDNPLDSLSKFYEKELQTAWQPVSYFLHYYLVTVYADALMKYRPEVWQYDTPAGEMRFWSIKRFAGSLFTHTLAIYNALDDLNKLNVKDYDAVVKNVTTDVYPKLSDVFVENISDKLSSSVFSSVYRPYFLPNAITGTSLISPFGNSMKIDDEIKENDFFALVKGLYLKNLKNAYAGENCNRFAQLEYDRISYFSKYLSADNVPDMVMASLEKDLKKYADKECSVIFAYHLAGLYDDTPYDFRLKQTHKYRFYRKKAANLCKTYINKYPDHRYTSNLKSLYDRITGTASLALSIDRQVLPSEKFVMSVEYRNLQEISLKIHRITGKAFFKARTSYYNIDKLLSELPAKSLVSEEKIKLPAETDYRKHKTELIHNGLKPGFYLVDVEGSGKHDYLTFQVTDLGFNYYNADKKVISAVSLTNGRILPKAEIFIITGNYKNNVEKNLGKGETVEANLKNNYRTFIKIAYKKDTAIYRLYATDYYGETKRAKQKEFIYTDRVTYRPGETVKYAVVSVRGKDGKKQVVAGKKLTVRLTNNFGKTISKQTAVTDESGMVTGEFVLPGDLVPGSYSISAGRGSKRINVEVYKLPKYIIEFTDLDKPYVLGDSVKVNGKVKTYSGMPVTGAVVEWKVYVSSYSVVKFGWFTPWITKYPVAEGKVTVDDNGNFNFVFLAKAKNLGNKADFEVTARVILPSGETRELSKNFFLRSKPFDIRLNAGNVIVKGLNDTVKVEVHSFTGAKVMPEYKMSVYKLGMRKVPVVYDACQDCDTTVYSSKEWYDAVPYYRYAGDTLKKGKLVFEKSFKGEKIKLPEMLDNGKYLVKITASYNKYSVSADEVVFLTSADESASLSEQPFYVKDLNNGLKVLKGGETLKYLVGSGFEKQTVHFLMFDGKTFIASKSVVLSGKQKIVPINVPSAIVNDFAVYVFTVAKGECYPQEFNFEKYKPAVKLEIQHLTDKTMPGKKEQTVLLLKDDKGNPQKGTLIAAMTDKSLENFGANKWNYGMSCYRPVFTVFDYSQGNIDSRYANVYKPSPYMGSTFSPSTGSITGSYYDWFGYYGERMNMCAAPVQKGRTRTLSSERAMPPEDEVPESGKVKEAENEETDTNEPQKQVRENFNPTAFFFAGIKFDDSGKASFSFVVPDALTTWHFRSLAYTNDWKVAVAEKYIVSNKPLMLITGMPRFLRQGDKILLPLGVSNLTPDNQKVKVGLEVYDAVTEKLIAKFGKDTAVGKNKTATVYFELKVPDKVSLIKYKAFVSNQNYTDIEKDFIPVLTSKTLVTQTLPFYMNKKGTKTLTFNEFNKYSKSSGLTNLSYTVEVTSNPVWFAVQTIPHLYDKDDYRFLQDVEAAYFATVSADYVVKQNPGIKKVFDKWKNLKSKDVFLSNLMKNKDLKHFVIENSPWLQDAADETEQKHRMGQLFDVNLVSYKKDMLGKKLLKLQADNGAWKWYKDAIKGDLYSTLDVLLIYGKLKKYYGCKLSFAERKAVESGMAYMEKQMAKRLEEIKKYDKDYKNHDYLSFSALKYLLARAYWKDIATKETEPAKFYREQAVKFWNKRGIYEKAVIGEYFVITGTNNNVVNKIIASLKDISRYDNEMGRYWKSSGTYGYYYNAGVLTHTAVLRFFTDAGVDRTYLDQMKVWLIKHKQTNMWESTATSIEAVQLLLADKSKFDINVTVPLQVKVGSTDVTKIAAEKGLVEPGTGYYKVKFAADQIKKDFGTVTVTKKDNKNIGWGAVYWRYLEEFDNVQSAGKKLKITREIYKETEKNGKKFYTKIENGELNPGDRIKVRLIVTADRDYEFIAVRDFRPSAFEPVGTKSEYANYKSTYFYKQVYDERTDFYFRYIPKGTVYLEYEAYVKYRGDFSGGISLAQSLYSPEFVSNTKGIRIVVKN